MPTRDARARYINIIRLSLQLTGFFPCTAIVPFTLEYIVIVTSINTQANTDFLAQRRRIRSVVASTRAAGDRPKHLS